MVNPFSTLTAAETPAPEAEMFPALKKIELKPLELTTIAPIQVSTKLQESIENIRKTTEAKLKTIRQNKLTSLNSTVFDGSDPTSEFDAFRRAVSDKESRGSGGYAAISPRNRDGDYAYGRYQIKGTNIPAWTKEVTGTALTPQQFLKNEDAQEKVFQAKVMQEYEKYGNWSDVASVWFSGGPMKTMGNKSDVTGQTVPKYVQETLALMRGYMKPKAVKQPAVGSMLGTLGAVTTPFGGQTSYESTHMGVDIANVSGTPIPSFVSGTIVKTVTGKKHGKKDMVTTLLYEMHRVMKCNIVIFLEKT